MWKWIFIKVYKIKIHCVSNLIVAAKYQLLKMQEDVALNVANAFTSAFLIRKTKSAEQLGINQKQLRAQKS
jgi:hypothetical protein